MNNVDLQLSILLPAFCAGLLVISTHVPLGREVLRRGILFIDLAVAQIAGLGVIAAHTAGLHPQGIGVQLTAMASALSGAFILNWCERHWPGQQEAIIGVAFILAATGSLLLLANSPQAGEHLTTLLVGQILWVDSSQLISTFVLYSLILIVWFKQRQRPGNSGFYVLFALSVTASVQLVGVYLVFATLIVPALACLHVAPTVRLGFAYSTAAIAYALGLFISAIADLPSGAVIVWMLVIVSLGGKFFRFEKLFYCQKLSLCRKLFQRKCQR